MEKISNFIVRYRKAILLIFIMLSICSGVALIKVNINSDMTKYLPEDSPAKIGAAIMSSEFSPASTFNLLFEDLSDADSVLEKLLELPYIASVSYNTTEKYNKDGYALFVVAIEAAVGTKEAAGVISTVKEAFSSYDITISGDAAGNTAIDILPMLIGIAFVILFIILTIMCKSWIESILLLLAIGVAVILNMGTNIIFESVSDITNAIAAILQLVLSMNYSIMMINRYRQEKELGESKTEAMAKTIKSSFLSISSSSITTIVGMLALVFMSFTIGADMGYVLAKGVFFSLLCVFTVLPTLVLMFDNAIEKTAKKSLRIKMDKIATVSYRARYGIPVIFIALFVTSYFLRGNVQTAYTMADYYKANQVFTIDNPIVVLYSNVSEEEVAALAENWDNVNGVTDVNAYSTTLGKAFNYREIADIANLDEEMAAQMFYSYLDSKGELPEQAIAFSELMMFIQNDVITNSQFASYFTPEIMEQFASMSAMLDPDMMERELTATEFAVMFGIDETIAQSMFHLYLDNKGELSEYRVALGELIMFIQTDVMTDPQFAPYFTPEILEQFGSMGAMPDSNMMVQELTAAELALILQMDEAMANQLFFMYLETKGMLPEQVIAFGELIIFIQADVMTDPQFTPYFTPEMVEQFGFMSTMLDPNMTAQELTPAKFATQFQMDEAMAKQLFYYHAITRGNPSAESTLEYKIPLYDFMMYLINNIVDHPAFASFMSDEMKAELTRVKDEMDEGRSQLVGNKFSRAILTTSLPEESEETFALIQTIRQELSSLSGEVYILGNSAMAYEMNEDFPSEMNRITILTVIAIFLVVAIAFRSFILPLIQVCIIQCAVFFTMGVVYLRGNTIYYLPLLIVQCLLLGATVDYGILLSSYYREARKTLELKEAIIYALNNSIHTIMTSGLILVMVTGVLGFYLNSSDPAISEILITIATGGICALILVIFILPGLLVAFDRFVVKRKNSSRVRLLYIRHKNSS